MRHILYALTWNPQKAKYDKKPLLSTTYASFEQAKAACDSSHVPGSVFDEGDSLFFLDLDHVIDLSTGSMTQEAYDIVMPLIAAGCFYETSVSGTGAHVIGRYSGVLPPHCHKRPAEHGYEFYTGGQGCAHNPNGGIGSMQADGTAAILPVLERFFQPHVSAVQAAELHDGPRADWRGPVDDDALIARMLNAQGSASSRFGASIPFKALWLGEVEKTSESDLALASHLAFWTGCDAARIERLMRRSGLAREKWDTHRTYLREITIARACSTTAKVYQAPEKQPTMPTPAPAGNMCAQAPAGNMGAEALATGASQTPSWHDVADKAIERVNGAQTYRELVDTAVPEVAALGLPRIHAERVVHALAKRLELFDSKLPISQVRALVSPPTLMTATADTPPDWLTSLVYVRKSDRFYNLETGAEYSAEGFRMEFNRFMPLKQTGAREDSVAWARDRWNVLTVDDLAYRPDQPQVFEYGGMRWGNRFIPTSMPAPTLGTEECSACIAAFQNHLFELVGRRTELYWQILWWLAHNVQKPGVKIRWSPLIKGVQGDGKSIFGDLLYAAMGASNVKMTSPSTLSNSGGFTDWATGRAVNFMEEVRLEGKDKRKLYNAMKIFIGDSRIELNKKGKASDLNAVVNVTNHWANTNHADAVPVEPGERRWCVIFSPWASIGEAAQAKGLDAADDNAMPRFFKRLGSSMRAEPGAWRAWLMGIDLSAFDPDGRAPWTPERDSMLLMSSDSIDQTVADLIEQGSRGVHKDAFSSSMLAALVAMRCQERIPTRTWNGLLVRLGYRQHPQPIKWQGATHRVWVKKETENNKIREILDSTI